MIDSALLLFETAINRSLVHDLQTLARLQEIDDKIIKLEITDWNLSFYIFPKHNGIELRQKINGDPDTTISGTLQSLLKVGLSDDKSRAMKQHKIKFNGDAHVGIAMQHVLAHIDIDWEEHLSKIIGDAPATLITKGFAQAMGIGKSIVDSIKRNTTEYIHHEAKLSPTRQELDTFYSDVGALRTDVERLEAKIKLLTRTG